MLDKIEQFADKIVDFLEWTKQTKKKNKKVEKKVSVSKEEIDSVYYEIIPYSFNDYGNKIFSSLLKNFSNFSQRINFYIYWNNSNTKLIVSFPSNLERKFITRFYNHFPSSKIQKIDIIWNTMFDAIQDSKINKFYYTIWDDSIQTNKNNNWIKEIWLRKKYCRCVW